MGVNVSVGGGVSVGSAVTVETGTVVAVVKDAGSCPHAETMNTNKIIQ
jgi:hypothetical protein